MPPFQDAAWAAGGLYFNTETHDRSLGRALGPSPTLSFSAQTDLSPGQGSPSAPWGDPQHPMAGRAPGGPQGLLSTPGGQITPSHRTSEEDGKDAGKRERTGSAGMRRALPQPQSLDSLRRAGARAAPSAPACPARPGCRGAEQRPPGHTPPWSFPWSPGQEEHPLLTTKSEQSPGRTGEREEDAPERSAVTASKTTNSSVLSKHSRCQAGRCTWIHNSFRQRPLLTGPAWVTRHASFCLPLATPHSLRDPRTRGGTAPSAVTGPNKRPLGVLKGRASYESGGRAPCPLDCGFKVITPGLLTPLSRLRDQVLLCLSAEQNHPEQPGLPRLHGSTLLSTPLPAAARRPSPEMRHLRVRTTQRCDQVLLPTNF